ncbi:hypothetical protein DICVIV_08014 [Dictyocaulus viviparus]|uniref:Uncharacterized protein n=1 Tax=Dictyocaulus viviparus TaxID=29172 RepID=A0A0D8XU80_DICVI|nr:hypothetical protein DICVIV_08014 [Dictyocaulus viviparus]
MMEGTVVSIVLVLVHRTSVVIPRLVVMLYDGRTRFVFVYHFLRNDLGVFEFLSRGQISRSHVDLKAFRDDSCLERFSSGVRDPVSFTHSLRLDSAVELSNIPFTNYTLDFKGMIDYIFSTPQSLARLGFLGAFDSTWVAQNKIIGPFFLLLDWYQNTL